MDLTGYNIIVLDLETARSADDCRLCGQSEALHHIVPQTLGLPLTGEKPLPCTTYEKIGWERKVDLGLSIGCYYDYQGGLYHWFDRLSLANTVRYFVDCQPLLVSYNGLAFDFALMRALLRHEDGLHTLCDTFKALCATSYDILAEIWKADSARKFEKGLNSLDAVSQANGYGAKEMDGATAPRLWRQGRYAEVLNYCQADVTKTKALFEQCISMSTLVRGDGLPLIVASPTLPPPPTERMAQYAAGV